MPTDLCFDRYICKQQQNIEKQKFTLADVWLPVALQTMLVLKKDKGQADH